MTLRFKPKDKQIRMIFTDGPYRVMLEHTGKVFAVIGPFDCFTDTTSMTCKTRSKCSCAAITWKARGSDVQVVEGD